MRNFILLILFFVSLNSLAQDFAPIGAKWYYTEGFAFSGDIGYLQIESIKDTLFQGKSCRFLSKTRVLECSNRPATEIIYSQDSAVYFWDKDFNEFQMLFNLKAAKDSSWSIKIKNHDESTDTILVTVDSVTNINILAETFKVLNVTYFPKYKGIGFQFQYSSKIVYPIGDFSYLFNLYADWNLACDMNYSGGLRCYEDSQFGYYSTGIADSCTYTHKWTDVENAKVDQLKVDFYPNPTQGLVHVDCCDNKDYNVNLFDTLGKVIKVLSFRGKTDLDISSYPNGIYYMLIGNDKGMVQKTKVIKINAR